MRNPGRRAGSEYLRLDLFVVTEVTNINTFGYAQIHTVCPPPSDLYGPDTWRTPVRRHGGHIETMHRSFQRRESMPWQEVSVVQSRIEFVALAQEGGNIRQLCRRFGISPSTAYKWLGRHRQGDDLSDRSRRPKHSPWRCAAGIEQAVLGRSAGRSTCLQRLAQPVQPRTPAPGPGPGCASAPLPRQLGGILRAARRARL